MNQIIEEKKLSAGRVLQIVQGDLTEEHVDAIVNAANSHLQHGGGVAGAIVRRGGPEIQAESNTWVRHHGPVRAEAPAITGGGKLPCHYIIHTVGPIWGEGDEERKLAAAVNGALQTAEHIKIKSLSIPAISTGIFGFPIERAAKIILATIAQFFERNPDTNLQLVRITLFDTPAVETFIKVWQANLGMRDSYPHGEQH